MASKTSAGSLIECLLFLLFCCLDAILVKSGCIDQSLQAHICVAILLALTGLSWYRFDRGMHPAFLFLCLLTLFQAGELICFVLGLNKDPFRITLQSFSAYDVNEPASSISMLMLAVSATLIYCPCRLRYLKKRYTPGPLARFSGWALLMFFATYPFLIYKEWKYLEYALRYGYLALYSDNGEHLKDVGLLVRALSQMCVAAFSLYFCWESSKRKLLWVSIPLFAALAADLFMGLRGKALLMFVSFLFLYKIKFNQRFSVITIVLLSTVTVFVSGFIGQFRESLTQNGRHAENPLVLFLDSQGVSFQVTELAVENRGQFMPYRWHYLLYPLLNGFRHQSDFGHGERFSNDLSTYLNAEQFSKGYATGSSYLAEAYIIGGAVGVMCFSLLIGCFLAQQAKWISDWRSPIAVLILISVMFIPRAELVDPIAAAIKPIISMVVLFAIMSLCATAKSMWAGSYGT